MTYKEALNFCKERGIGIKMCPISNLQTKGITNKYNYPLREFWDNGLLATINTDIQTVSNTPITKELLWIQREYGITDQELTQIQKMLLKYLLHFDSSLLYNFIYRDRRQTSPLPQQIKPEAGKGHPIHSSDLLHTFLSVSLGGVAYRRRSGVILFIQHGAAMPVPFLMTVPFFFLPSKKGGFFGASPAPEKSGLLKKYFIKKQYPF